MVRHMILFVVLLSGLSALGQTPPVQHLPSAPPTGHFECWQDVQEGHYNCMSAKGSVLDVNDALDKLDLEAELETVWGTQGNGGGDIPNPPFLIQLLNQAAEPMDVPAVHSGTKAPIYLPCSDGQITIMSSANVGNTWGGTTLTGDNWGTYPSTYPACKWPREDYCKDKSRILLPPDGNGKHWCHKVQQ